MDFKFGNPLVGGLIRMNTDRCRSSSSPNGQQSTCTVGLWAGLHRMESFALDKSGMTRDENSLKDKEKREQL